MTSEPGRENSGGENDARDPRIAAALARNDRYLHEFVEALALCPWAKRCREIGRLARHVILEDGASLPAVVEAAMLHVRALGAEPAAEVEVGLLIFPALVPALRDGLDGSRAFEQLCAAVRDAMAEEYAASAVPFYCVAFHPELGMDLADENRAVRFIRRSPDPTLQLVRVSVLLEARGSEGSTRYVDASRMTPEELMAVRRPPTISEKIAQANWETLKREGPERLRELLGEMVRR